MLNVTTIASAAAVAGALGFAALGLGPGVAHADPALPGIPWQQDDDGGWGGGHGHGHGHWGGGGGDWGGGPGWGGGGPGWGWGPGVGACVSATGPWGYVTGSACI